MSARKIELTELEGFICNGCGQVWVIEYSLFAEMTRGWEFPEVETLEFSEMTGYLDGVEMEPVPMTAEKMKKHFGDHEFYLFYTRAECRLIDAYADQYEDDRVASYEADREREWIDEQEQKEN